MQQYKLVPRHELSRYLVADGFAIIVQVISNSENTDLVEPYGVSAEVTNKEHCQSDILVPAMGASQSVVGQGRKAPQASNPWGMPPWRRR